MKLKEAIIIFMLLPLLIFNFAFAQKTGKIVGKVIDAETGDALPGANVLIVGTSLGAAADIEGNFVILRVPPGTHSVRADFIGYQSTITQEVQVLTDLTSKVDFALKTMTLEIGETVVVTAERPIVRKDLTSAESRVQADEIDRLPVQDVGDVLNLQAGVTRDAGGGIHIRGGRSTEVSYMVNGIRITDDFSRSQSLEIENESIQELQVISGTFNAEYGDAMSGIVNIVTKTGGNNFRGSFETYFGDYISPANDIFWNIDDVNPVENYNFQGSLSGPIINDRISFFATGRRWYNDGWLYGPNAFMPQGSTPVYQKAEPVPGDSAAVAMNSRERWSGQATLEWKISSPLKLRMDALGSAEKGRGYNHFFRLNPNGYRGGETVGYTMIANLTHILGKNTFYEIITAYKFNEITSKLYDDSMDSGYQHPDLLNTPAFQFGKAGTDNGRFERSTKSWNSKFDLTSQASKRHQVKTGFEIRWDEVFFESAFLVPRFNESGEQDSTFIPEIRSPNESSHDLFTRKPFNFSAYIQDKIEYESLIINIGLRFDFFDAKGKILSDPEDPNIYTPFKLKNIYKDTNSDGVISQTEQTGTNKYSLAEREAFWYKDTSIKTQVSPRLGVAYPITDKGVIHFSYGIFQQVPEYSQLYAGDQLKVTSASGTQGPYGNPDLNPQRTIMYELGLQQQITENIGIDITGFYRDIRDWVSTSPPIPTALAGVAYSTKINRDFANVKGLTLAVQQRMANNFSFNVDYTFQVAEGTNSTPEEEFFAQLGGAEPTRVLTPLGWDQTHSFNTSIFYGGKNWGVSLLERYNSGQPYTPSLVTGSRTGSNILQGLEKNSRRKPNRFTIDLTAFKIFDFSAFQTKFFVRVYNLLDSRNPVNIYGDTGLADFTLMQEQGEQADADATWFVRPDFYSEPRRFQVGAKISF